MPPKRPSPTSSVVVPDSQNGSAGFSGSLLLSDQGVASLNPAVQRAEQARFTQGQQLEPTQVQATRALDAGANLAQPAEVPEASASRVQPGDACQEAGEPRPSSVVQRASVVVGFTQATVCDSQTQPDESQRSGGGAAMPRPCIAGSSGWLDGSNHFLGTVVDTQRDSEDEAAATPGIADEQPGSSPAELPVAAQGPGAKAAALVSGSESVIESQQRIPHGSDPVIHDTEDSLMALPAADPGSQADDPQATCVPSTVRSAGESQGPAVQCASQRTDPARLSVERSVKAAAAASTCPVASEQQPDAAAATGADVHVSQGTVRDSGTESEGTGSRRANRAVRVNDRAQNSKPGSDGPAVGGASAWTVPDTVSAARRPNAATEPSQQVLFWVCTNANLRLPLS